MEESVVGLWFWSVFSSPFIRLFGTLFLLSFYNSPFFLSDLYEGSAIDILCSMDSW